ncbi:MAG: hypothetical protein JXB10_07970 [Pirellulales bacterium]|nr:hypothetical protein [Pirellulales bacterium]
MSNEEPLMPDENPALQPAEEEQLPDPNGPPQPVKGPSPIRSAVTAVVCLMIGGTLFTMCSIECCPCMGATRSSKLEWQKRQQQIQQAWEEDQKSSSENAGG